jgi:hypothetical protein
MNAMIQTNPQERFGPRRPESSAPQKLPPLGTGRGRPTLSTAEVGEEYRADIEHPHAYMEELPDQPPIQVIRELSRLNQFRAGRAIVAEWLGIAVAIALCARFWSLPLVEWLLHGTAGSALAYPSSS